MKKKVFLGLALVAFVAGGAFALPELKLSAGAGGYFTSDFGGGAEASGGGQTLSIKTPYAGGGGFAFFDATFAELSLGFFGGGGTIKSDVPEEAEEFFGSSAESDISVVGLDIGLLGKYPFAISDKLTVFPLVGINYRAILSAKLEDEDVDDPGDFSALWFKFGGGLDFSFTDKLYLHSGLLYGLRLANTFENDMVDSYDEMAEGLVEADTKTLLGHGLEIKLAVGYRF
jgi:hypothetical protein